MSQSIIELSNVNIYQGENLVLEDVNISVDKGEFVYLVGKTGTGKSSLLKHYMVIWNCGKVKDGLQAIT